LEGEQSGLNRRGTGGVLCRPSHLCAGFFGEVFPGGSHAPMECSDFLPRRRQALLRLLGFALLLEAGVPSDPRLGEGGVIDAHVRGAPVQTVRWTVREVLVPGAGIDPARPKAPDFKSGMSTSSIIRACKNNRLLPLATHSQHTPKPAPRHPSGLASTRTQVILSPL